MRNTLFRPDLSYGNAFEFVYQLPILGSLAMGNVAQVFASISKGRKMIEPKTGEKWNIFQKEINSGQIVTATHVGRSRFIAGLRFPVSKNDITFYLLLSALSQNSASEHKFWLVQIDAITQMHETEDHESIQDKEAELMMRAFSDPEKFFKDNGGLNFAPPPSEQLEPRARTAPEQENKQTNSIMILKAWIYQNLY